MVKTSDFIQLHLSEDLHRKAYKLAYTEKSNYNEQTIRKDNSGRYAGFIGELSLMEYLEGTSLDYEWQNSNPRIPNYNYDFKINDVRIDVKTKDRTVEPKLFYECSIAEYSKDQDCDYYIFCSLTKNRNLQYPYYTNNVLGYISKKEYFEKAYYRKKGEIDPSNGFATPKSCYNLKISELQPLSTLVAILTLKTLDIPAKV
jgi:hypothetical protein